MLANLTSQLLRSSGYANFAESGFLPSSSENLQGFFETRLLVETNNYLLESVDSNWDKPFLFAPPWDSPEVLEKIGLLRERFVPYQQEPWIDKDPRLCLVWGAYRHLLLQEPVGILVIRDPLVVANSLHFRNGFTAKKSALIWLLYHYHILVSAAPQKLCCISDQDILDCREYTIDALIDFIRIHQNIHLSHENVTETAAKICRPDLRRAVPIQPKLCELLEYAHDIWLRWNSTSWGIEELRQEFRYLPSLLIQEYGEEFTTMYNGDQNSSQSISHLHEDLARLNQNVDQLKSNIDSIKLKIETEESRVESARNAQEVLALSDKVNYLQTRLTELQLSISWRLTAPLRMVMRIAKGQICVWFKQ